MTKKIAQTIALSAKSHKGTFLQPLNHHFVGGQPLNAIQLFFSQPPCSLMFLQRQTTTLHMTPKTMHRKVELGILPLNGLHQPFHQDSRFQFLPYFTLQRLFRCLSIFYLSAREFPSVLIITISSLSGEDTAFVIV